MISLAKTDGFYNFMNHNQFDALIQYIAAQGVKAIKDNTDETDFQIDYVAIFAKTEKEFDEFIKLASTLGVKKEMGIAATGSTFLLNEPVQTEAGPVSYVKIRKPDPTRPQRGGPDFRVKDFYKFKEKYLQKSGNFVLMVRKDYEMIELKGVDVLVYFPSKFAEIRSNFQYG